MRKRGLLAATLVFPNAVMAECLGPNCYDGIALFIGVIFAVAATLVITLVVLLWKRKFRAALVLVGICVAAWFIAAFTV